MAGKGVSVTTNLTTEDCITCGVLFAMEDGFIHERQKDHRTWYCPNGHDMYYDGESETESLKRELGSVKAERTFWLEEAERQKQEADRKKREAAAAKGQLTKARNRAAAGVCLECHRTFTNVARHMQSKHGAHNEGMVGKS